MTKRYSIAEARHNLAAIVHELEDEPVVELTRRGAPVAVLVSLEEYRRLRATPPSFWAAYMAYRASHDPTLLDAVSDAFAGLRDPSPGRKVTW